MPDLLVYKSTDFITLALKTNLFSTFFYSEEIFQIVSKIVKPHGGFICTFYI